MIGQLRGNVISKNLDSAIIDVQGVGYEVTITQSAYYKLPESSETVTIHIYTHVREDQLHLFGFLNKSEKELFQMMISVSGIGPKVAMNIISEISPQDLIQAVLGGNTQKFSAMKGIGKKSAERIILELKGKIKKLSFADEKIEVPKSDSQIDDLVSALSNLGYKQNEIDRALSHIRSVDALPDVFEDLLKQSLQYLRG